MNEKMLSYLLNAGGNTGPENQSTFSTSRASIPGTPQDFTRHFRNAAQHLPGFAEVPILRPFAQDDQAFQSRRRGRRQPSLGILDHDALLWPQLVPGQGRQIWLRVRLGVLVVPVGDDEIEILRQPGPRMGDVEVLAMGACDHAHSHLAVQGPQDFFRPVDKARLRSQELGVNPVTLGPEAGDFVGWECLAPQPVGTCFRPA